MKRLLLCVGVVVGVVILQALVWPDIQHEMMREPLMDAVDAIRANNTTAVLKSFTEDAQVSYKDPARNIDVSMPVERAITLLEPHMRSGELRGMASVRDLENITPISDDVFGADVTITFYIEGNEDIPYRNIPYSRSGHVELKRLGWLSYKIQRITTGAADFRGRLQ